MYYDKYIKYKTKYLKLKNQKGGAMISVNKIHNFNRFIRNTNEYEYLER